MADINPVELADMASELFAIKVYADMGAPGVEALKRLLPIVRQVHLAVSTERVIRGMDIVYLPEDDAPCLAGAYAEFSEPAALTSYFDGRSGLTVQILGHGIRVWTKRMDTQPVGEFIGYRYFGPHLEVIFSAQGTYKVPKITTFPSVLGIPYFRQLRSLLERYGATWIKHSMCDIFGEAWLDERRLVFKPGPEVLMRRSLQRYLRSALREHSGVRPEQNVNETRPVDLKVIWAGFNRVALIEIKWLGKSARPGEMSTTQNFTASQARNGARQLASYLDLYHKEYPAEEARGYLVVYDARRRNVRLPPSQGTKVDAMFYRNSEIDYDPEIISRSDFDYPLRFFCEPVEILFGIQVIPRQLGQCSRSALFHIRSKLSR